MRREGIQGLSNSINDDAKLVKMYCQGDLKAFESLYQKHRRAVYLRALGMVKDKEDALDVVQECFMRVSKSAVKLRQRRKFRPWLMKIVTNLCLKHLRAKSTVQLVSLSEPSGNHCERLPRQIADESPQPAEVLENSEIKQKLWQAISSLPSKQREVFASRCVEGLSCKETAEAINCSERTVKLRLARAKSAIQEQMMPYRKLRLRKKKQSRAKNS